MLRVRATSCGAEMAVERGRVVQGVAARLSGEHCLQNPWINPSLCMRNGEKLLLFQALEDREEGVQATVVYVWAPSALTLSVSVTL